MINHQDLASLAGNTMTGTDGRRIGKIVDVYESTEGSDGTFVTVATGMFGGGASFVPLAQASLQGTDVLVPYDKDLVKDAPRVEADQNLSSAEEARLYQHYNLDTAGMATAASGSAGTSPLKKFLLRGNLVDLAVGVSIGAAFGALVLAIVEDFIAPVLAIVAGQSDFSALTFTIMGAKFGYGDFVTKLIAFLIIGIVVYFLVVVPFTNMLERFKPSPADPGPVHNCPHCLSSVPTAATACAFCTRDLDPALHTTSSRRIS